VAAAACIAILCTGAWFLFVKQPAVGRKGLAHAEQATVLPGTNKAVLTLADGRQIMLDNTAGKTITDQNGIKISNQAASGQLAYHSPEHNDSLSTVYYNVLTTPRGGQYEVLLADGSHVWLNAASSLKYPNRFTGKERTVEVTGEAYFEIAGNPAKPFRIKVNDNTAVEVLGTHFNINAYRDEEAIKTTLIEGSVRVAGAKGTALLKPGQQCVSAAPGSVDRGLKITAVNTDAVIAWKNGIFSLHNQGVAEVMRQLTRWYDIEVEYKGKAPAITFWGEMSRYENLSSILDFMRESGINFKIENGGKKITVIP
jgi:ferric-dicitrate binding protein FerR (iron transport regulator)